MDQHFAHYEKWECFKNGMYSSAQPTLKMVNSCASLLCNRENFKEACIKVLTEWPISAKVHLTDRSLNRRAYLGRSACCLMFGANEETVSIAWKLISKQHQISANEIADKIISQFESNSNSESQLTLF